MKKNLSLLFLLVFFVEIYSQDFAITTNCSNHLYYGTDNPVKIIAENRNCKSLVVSTDNGLIKGNTCEFYINPSEYRTAIISLKAVNKKDTVAIGSKAIKVEYIPNPVAIIAGMEGGKIERSLLLHQAGIETKLVDFCLDVKFKVQSFSVFILQDKNVLYNQDFTGKIFNPELKQAISDAKIQNIVRFEKIIATGEDGTTRLLKPVVFEIK